MINNDARGTSQRRPRRAHRWQEGGQMLTTRGEGGRSANLPMRAPAGSVPCFRQLGRSILIGENETHDC
eukprot:6402337-Pyramimonas_sp.AAC.1